MHLELNPDQKEFEVFDCVMTGHFVNLKLIRLKESVLKSEVVLEVSSSNLEEKNQLTHEKEFNTIDPARKKLRISNKLVPFILYKIKETELTRHEVNKLFHIKNFFKGN
jgi:hypothetical protein